MSVVGVDGCKGGWFAIRLEDDKPSCGEVFGNIKELSRAEGKCTSGAEQNCTTGRCSMSGRSIVVC
jgi:hypothetical protein